MEKRLLKDITIPAGTIFQEAPRKTARRWGGFYECVIGLTADTCGEFTYAIPSSDESELKDFFETVG